MSIELSPIFCTAGLQAALAKTIILNEGDVKLIEERRIMRRLVFDLDGTITHIDPKRGYDEVLPNEEVVSKLREYKADGYEIIIQTARNMKTYANSIGKITAFTLPVVIEWLNRHQIPFDEIHVGKPWCGHDGFYVDDRAIRPSEFISMSPEDIARLLGNV